MKVRAAYHSPLRQSQAAATRERIVAACVGLLEVGAELTYSAVAVAAGARERTVYRHFPTKSDLEAAVWSWIVDHHTHADFTPFDEEGLIVAMRRSFAGFEATAPLIRGMLRSRQGLEIRRGQQAARREMFERCVDSACPRAPASLRTQAAASLQVLYSAPSWELLNDFWGMDAATAADSVELAIRALFTSLRDRTPANSKRRDK